MVPEGVQRVSVHDFAVVVAAETFEVDLQIQAAATRVSFPFYKSLLSMYPYRSIL
jgi:hypothetical protein